MDIKTFAKRIATKLNVRLSPDDELQSRELVKITAEEIRDQLAGCDDYYKTTVTIQCATTDLFGAGITIADPPFKTITDCVLLYDGWDPIVMEAKNSPVYVVSSSATPVFSFDYTIGVLRGYVDNYVDLPETATVNVTGFLGLSANDLESEAGSELLFNDIFTRYNELLTKGCIIAFYQLVPTANVKLLDRYQAEYRTLLEIAKNGLNRRKSLLVASK